MISKKQRISSLKLFKNIPIEEERTIKNTQIFEEALENRILLNYDKFNREELNDILEVYKLDIETLNNTFHKSFSVVKDSSIDALISQQLIHYFTTYGLESMGLYNENLVYIPAEKLEIPELTIDVPLIVINKISLNELKEKLLVLLTSNIALSKDTIDDVINLSDYIDKDSFDKINNREIKIFLYEKYNIVPKQNVEFLRYIIYKLTSKTLLIQNKELIQIIKNSDLNLATKLFQNYINTFNGYKKLAEIFLRYKKIFLAFKNKNYPELNKIINKISKLSKKYHKPLQPSILDTLTSQKHNEKEIIDSLNNVSIFREIRILNSLRYREFKNKNDTQPNYDIIYKIRNGKAYISKLKNKYSYNALINIINEHLKNRINKLWENKSIYFPDNIQYVIPTSEKQFVGNIPSGSSLTIPKDNIVVGIKWKNLKNPEERIDLDLHLNGYESSFGWDSAYRGKDIFFSGDITDAPNGATEVFYIGKDIFNSSLRLSLNNYTPSDRKIPFELIVATANEEDINKNYIINPNNVICKVPFNFETNINNITLGIIKIDENINFYFNNFNVGKSITSHNDEITNATLKCLEDYSLTQYTLRELCEESNIKISTKPTIENLVESGKDKEGNILYKKEYKPVDYDLSLETLQKDSLIKMFIENT